MCARARVCVRAYKSINNSTGRTYCPFAAMSQPPAPAPAPARSLFLCSRLAEQGLETCGTLAETKSPRCHKTCRVLMHA